MFTALDIKNVTFSSSMRGFKQDEVDVFLDQVEADYVQFESLIKEKQAKIAELEAEIENYKNSQDSIQNVLLSAQRLADQIVNEAKEKSEEIIVNAEKNISVITAQEKELASAFEAKANERKENLQKELDKMIEKANLKAKSVTDAAAESVQRQQILFDKLKLEIAAFKSAISSKYKEHLSILQDIPDTVKMSPAEMAEIISAKIDAVPEPEDFIPKAQVQENIEVVAEAELSGFTVDNVLSAEETEE